MKDKANELLPVFQPKGTQRWRDPTLAALCVKSRLARGKWKAAGSPREGSLFEEKCKLRREVRRRVRFCAAQRKKSQLRSREKKFASGDNTRFRRPGRRSTGHTRLKVGEDIVSEPAGLCKAWSHHFEELARSTLNSHFGLKGLKRHIEALSVQSTMNEEYLLDIPFEEEEVRLAIKRLKRSKAPGPDGLTAEHLQGGGECVVLWLTRIINCIVELEEIPNVLKVGLVVPVYKGSNKDPLNMNSYRGITLSNVISKVLEFLLLERMRSIFHEANVPHPNQSAYRKKTSCADAIMATQEAISRYVEGGDQVFMCLYDLQKAFDTVEYPVLLKRLYDIGVNGKMWRLIKNWYMGARCQVKLESGYLSDSYSVERGVKQGSVLSPTLFLLIMDPLITKLQSYGCGLSINNFFCGAYLHADDIRTLATSPDSLNMQVNLVNNFANENFLKLNFQ